MADKYEEMRKRMSLYRRSLALAQNDVAVTLGVSQSRLSKGENGHESISSDFLIALYNVGWDIDYIVTGKKWKKKRRTLREELIEFSDENDIFIVIHWAISGLYKKYNVNKVYRLELNLLNFVCHNKNIKVFEAIRHVYDMSQLEYAELLHLTIRKCRSIEKGVTYPSADLLGELYEMLGCRPTLLLDTDNVKWNILENIWNQIPQKDEKQFVDFINNAIIYYNQISDD